MRCPAASKRQQTRSPPSGAALLPVVADLLDRASLAPAVGVVLDKWGRVDVLVNNAVDTGAGGMVPVVELTPEQLERKLDANVVSQLVITQAALPDMLERGTGIIINVTSTVAVSDPPAPVGKGGWGLSYAASKGAFHRMAGILAVELGDRGIEAFNVDPGFVDTERQIVNARANGLEGHYVGAPPSVPAAVIAWLATSPDAAGLSGQTVHAREIRAPARPPPGLARPVTASIAPKGRRHGH